MDDVNSSPTPQANINPTEPPRVPKKKSGIVKKVMLVILVLLLMAASAGAAYYFTKEQAEKDAAAIIEPLVAQLEEIEAAQKSAAEAEVAESSFLEIDQWGVKLTPTASEMSYKITKNSNGTETAWLTNKDAQALSATAQDLSCNKDGSGGQPNHWYLASVVRSKNKLTGVYESMTATKIGDYFYYADQANGGCSKEASLQAESAARQELYRAAQSVQSNE